MKLTKAQAIAAITIARVALYATLAALAAFEICVNNAKSDEDIEKGMNVLEQAMDKITNNLPTEI